MKKLCLLLVVLLGTAAATERRVHAQMIGSIDFTTDFAFYAGNALMPAGSYTVRKEALSEPILLIESEKALNHSALLDYLPMHANTPHPQSDVVFERYGDREYLSKLWIEGEQFGMKIPRRRLRSSMRNPRAQKNTA